MQLEPLGELKLAFDAPFTLLQPYGTEEGTGWGRGGGTMEGERLRGRVEWLNVPHRRSDVVMLPHVHGRIDTDDGATVIFFFEGRTPVTGDEAGQQLLRVTFETDAPSYAWLNTAFVVAEGIIVEEPAGSQVYVMRAVLFQCIHELK